MPSTPRAVPGSPRPVRAIGSPAWRRRCWVKAWRQATRSKPAYGCTAAKRRPIRHIGVNQIVLAWKVPVERDLGHAGFGNDAIDAGGAHAIPVEKFVRGVQDALARTGQRVVPIGLGVHAFIVDRSVYMT